MRSDRPARGEHGQAAAEYVAVLAVVAALLTTAAAAGSPGGVANAVVGQMRRALCVVTGSECSVHRSDPCVLSAERDRRHHSLTVAVMRLDDDRMLLRERLSDGTVRLTLTKLNAVGVEAALGAGWRVTGDGLTVGVGGQLRGSLLALIGDGRVFHASSEAAADRIQRRLESGELPLALDRPYRFVRGLLGGGKDRPHPDEVFFEGGLRALGRAGVSRAAADLRLDALSDNVLGARHDRRARQVTVYLRARRAAGALASAVLGAGGDMHATGVLAVTLDRRTRRPLRLALEASGAVDGNVRLPPPLTALLDLGEVDRAEARVGGEGVPRVALSGRRWELDARVDLDDPAVGAAWAAFRRSPGSVAAVGALGARLRERARVDVRSYGTSESRSGFGGRAALGAGLGFETERSAQSSRLLSASSRPPGGAWEPRTDCGSRA